VHMRVSLVIRVLRVVFLLAVMMMSDTVMKVDADPLTKPYISYLTSPFDQSSSLSSSSSSYVTDHIDWSSNNDADADADANLGSGIHLEQCSNNNNKNSRAIPLSIHHSTPSYQLSDMAILSPPAIYRYSGGNGGGGDGRVGGGGKSLYFLRHEEILDAVHFHPRDEHEHENNHEDENEHAHSDPFPFMQSHHSYPMLFQGSTFAGSSNSPLIIDANQDGREDIVIVDYDGMITIMELESGSTGVGSGSRINDDGNGNEEQEKEQKQHTRFFQEIQLPRLALRKDWVELTLKKSMNIDESDNDNDNGMSPYDSYFDYMSATSTLQYTREEEIHATMKVRGESADVLHQSQDVVEILTKSRNNRKNQQQQQQQQQQREEMEIDVDMEVEVDDLVIAEEHDKPKPLHGRRLQEMNVDVDVDVGAGTDMTTADIPAENENQATDIEVLVDERKGEIVGQPADGDETVNTDFVKNHNAHYHNDIDNDNDFNDEILNDHTFADADANADADADEFANGNYYMYDDDFYAPIGEQVSSEEKSKRQFHHEDNYLHLPPHVLSGPTYFEALKDGSSGTSTSSGRSDFASAVYGEYLAIAVSYYFDEDEYAGSGASASADTNMNMRNKRFVKDWITGSGESEEDSEAKRGQFVANALVVIDLQDPYDSGNSGDGGEIHLDLSTDSTAPLRTEEELLGGNGNENEDGKKAKMEGLSWHEDDYDGMGAYALASPVVADLNRDGKMEAIVVTSMGFIHCIPVPKVNGIKNRIFTVQMKNRIEHPVLVGDVLGHAALEVIAMDADGNIVCLDALGKTMWHRPLIGTSNEPDPDPESKPSLKPELMSDLLFSDVNGDGDIDIVVTVFLDKSATVYALAAATGRYLDGFPINLSNDTPRRTLIPSPVAIHQSQPGDSLGGANTNTNTNTIILQPWNSKLFIIQPMMANENGCMQTFDLGSEISSVQVAELDDNDIGMIHIIATSISGEIITLETHLNLSKSLPHIHSTHSRMSDGLRNIFVDERSRKWRNIVGTTVPVTFTLVDTKPTPMKGEEYTYPVEIRVNRSSKNIIFRKVYDSPGTFTEKLELPFPPGYYTLTIRLRTHDGIIVDDEIQFSYNINSFSVEMLSLMVSVPLLVVAVALLLLSKERGDEARKGGGILA